MSYWRIPLAGNVTWGSDEVKTKVLIVGVRTDLAEEQFKKQLDGKEGLAAVRRACANFALSEAESYFSDRIGVMTRFLERNETIPVDKPTASRMASRRVLKVRFG